MRYTLFLIATLYISTVFGRSPEVVKDAPKWFFSPPKSAYVGVSVPLKNTELTKQQAIYTALLSYVVQNNVEVTIENMGHIFEIGVENTNGTEVRRENMNNLRWSLPNRYEIIKTAINQYGEMFVLLEVRTSCNCPLEMSVEHYMLSTTRNGHEDVRHRITYTLQDKSIASQKWTISGFSRIHNDNVIQQLTVARTANNTSREERFVRSDTPLAYSSLAGNRSVRTNSVWSRFPMRYSLGMAYMMALLQGFVFETIDIGYAKNESSRQVVDMINPNPETASKIHRDVMFFTAHYKVTNPAKSLKVEVDRGNLYLLRSN
jgi:hypothetical protein